MSTNQNSDQIVVVKKFRYAINPILGISLSVFFTVVAFYFLRNYFQTNDQRELFIAIIALIIDGLILINTFPKRFILICEDRIIIECLIKKDQVIFNQSINGVKAHEHKGNDWIIVERKGEKDIWIDKVHLKNIEFYEILEHIETLLAKKYSDEKPKAKEVRLEEQNLKSKWLFGIYSSSLSCLLIFFLPTDQMAVLDFTPFIITGLACSVTLQLFIWKKFLPNVDHIISKPEQWFYLFFGTVLPAGVIATLLVFINTKFDSNPGEIIRTNVVKMLPSKRSSNKDCYRIIGPKDGQPISSLMGGYCKENYPSISEDAKVYGRLKPGFLGGEWIEVGRIE